jgi:hypothetical protein
MKFESACTACSLLVNIKFPLSRAAPTHAAGGDEDAHVWVRVRPLRQGDPKVLVRIVSTIIGDHVKGAAFQEAVAFISYLTYQ